MAQRFKKIRLLPSTDAMEMREYKSLKLPQHVANSHLLIKQTEIKH